MKDPNEIVKIEKAIAQKYGEDTIANPKHYWRYRMHIPIEELIKNDNFNKDLQYCIISNGR